jgi:NTP pyrophosphatase (non-canonical NTP hydrolase)
VHQSEIEDIHSNAVVKGFWREPFTPDFVLAKLCLVHSEVSEIMEAYRKQHGSEAIIEEFADTFIRMYDLLVGLYEEGVVNTFNIDEAIRGKMAKNAARPKLHGNLI